MLQRDVPCATPLSPRSVLNLTSAMPPLCVAVPDIPIDTLDVVNWAVLVGERIRTTGGACSSAFGVGASVRRSLTLLDVDGAALVTGADGMTGGGSDMPPRGSGGAGGVTGAGVGSTTVRAGAAVEFSVWVVTTGLGGPVGAGTVTGVGFDGLLRVTVVVAIAALPAASFAVTVMMLTPTASGTLGVLHPVVPNATPLPPALFDHDTCATPVSSLAVPPSTIEDSAVEYDAAVVGV